MHTQIPNVMVHTLNNNVRFVEIRPLTDDEKETEGATIQAVAAQIAPGDCSRIVKYLTKEFPLPEQLKHLKRVRKQQQEQQSIQKHSGEGAKTQGPPASNHTNIDLQPNKKKTKLMPNNKEGTTNNTAQLEILIGLEASDVTEEIRNLVGPLHAVTVPRRPPQSQEEANEAKKVWPTHFFPLKSQEYQNEQLSLSMDEMTSMDRIMKDAILCANDRSSLVVDPATQSIVSNSLQEAQTQGPSISNNPLATPILLAIQGVSRLEREAELAKAVDDSSLDSVHEKKGQYLCTGYDLYCNYSPSVFESMACVHSRLRRVVYCAVPLQSRKANNSQQSSIAPTRVVWHDGLSKHRVHSLPGTNHRFRAFEYQYQQQYTTSPTSQENAISSVP